MSGQRVVRVDAKRAKTRKLKRKFHESKRARKSILLELGINGKTASTQTSGS